ncbi:MAG: hypothetical protein AAFR04_11185 [Pseudomonadota bacterium]
MTAAPSTTGVNAMVGERHELPAIPVVRTGANFPLETLQAERARAMALLDAATRGIPKSALRVADRLSRIWLRRHANPHLDEIDQIAALVGRPGAHFLSVNYEWGCTTAAKPSPDGASARLVRVLDWRTRGLGRHVVAADVDGPGGRYLTLTWPGYTGVLQAMAPGRFAAALNQAPMRQPIGLLPLDWAVNRARVWGMPHPTSAHLLRQVMEQAATFEDAQDMLTRTPVAAPAIYVLAGLTPDALVTIERLETGHRVYEGHVCAANHWRTAVPADERAAAAVEALAEGAEARVTGEDREARAWQGRARGKVSATRASRMGAVDATWDDAFAWLAPPILNPTTRLAMVADAAQGRVIARGYEPDGVATAPLDVTLEVPR